MRFGLEMGGKIMENQNEIEIDLMSLLLRLKTKIWIIILVTVIFALGGYVGSKLFSTPMYAATSQVYVYQANSGMDYNELALATQLRKDCALIIQGESVARKVIERLGLQTTPGALMARIKVSSEDNTRILNLTYTGADPEQAALIVNTVREVAAEEIYNLMEVKVLRTIYEASVPQAASNMNTKRTAVIAAAMGMALSVAVLVVIFLLDDTIRTEDDVQNYLGLSTLATIPVSDDLYAARGGKKNGSQRKKQA